MAEKRKLPIGIEDFERIRRDGFYYVDKTRMIKDLLEHMAYVNLFTRPRRFGKTLNMSMLKCFFEIGSNRAIFDGLEISRERELCDQYMGKFPVIAVSLKNVESGTLAGSRGLLRGIMGDEALRFPFLAESSRLTEAERRQYKAMIHIDEKGSYTMSDELLMNSLLILSHFLCKHYGQKVIILIDEYDVPLDKAYQSGTYEPMVTLIRVLFGQALKTNSSLYFAVLTGCLRISKESIFTGLNNFNVYTVQDVRFNESFGFTDSEVRKILKYYGFTEQYEAIKEWYDGYQFGNLGIYCPWDVIRYCDDLRDGNAVKPRNYWVNTSSNDIIRSFISRAGSAARNDLELLIGGGWTDRTCHSQQRDPLDLYRTNSGMV